MQSINDSSAFLPVSAMKYFRFIVETLHLKAFIFVSALRGSVSIALIHRSLVFARKLRLVFGLILIIPAANHAIG